MPRPPRIDAAATESFLIVKPGTTALAADVKHLQSLVGVRSRAHDVTLGLQQDPRELEVRRVVIDDQNRFTCH
jgi:hypothetical protein